MLIITRARIEFRHADLISIKFSSWVARWRNIRQHRNEKIWKSLDQVLFYFLIIFPSLTLIRGWCWLLSPELQYSCLENPMDGGASRLQSMWSLRVGHYWATSLWLFTFMHWRRKWQHTPVFLPGKTQAWGKLVGCHLWGCTESDMTEAT